MAIQISSIISSSLAKKKRVSACVCRIHKQTERVQKNRHLLLNAASHVEALQISQQLIICHIRFIKKQH